MWLLIASHSPQGGREVGLPLPPIEASGWLNGVAPKPDELNDKVLVIVAWASWCAICRREAPELVYLYEKYHDQGVEFIGLSGEPAEDLPKMVAFIKATGTPWVNGYGAEETLTAMGAAEVVPMVWVVDRRQRIVWNRASAQTLEAGIRQALSSK